MTSRSNLPRGLGKHTVIVVVHGRGWLAAMAAVSCLADPPPS
jgi:hypothetical protein